MQGRCYGISLVWVHPNQVKVATIEEAVENLTSYTSSGVDWPYALAQLCEDPHHAPLPKNKHLGILLQGKAQETFYGQMSRCGLGAILLSAMPDVITWQWKASAPLQRRNETGT